jgi:V/A-type H+-transporting ATPase subunit I
VSLLVGLLHLNVGYVLDFAENLEFHDLTHAITESGSWILMMNGLWVWVLSLHAEGVKPAFLYTVFDGTGAAPEASGEFAHAAFSLGSNGLPPTVGLLGAAAFGIGLVLLVVGEPVEAVEFLQVLVNVLSYTRIAAVLLAKAGMAFTVNLLFFGAYQSEGEFHFLLTYGPDAVEHGEVLFGGLIHGGPALVLVGLVVLVLGHALVLALGVTSAGLQAVRLEYVEFFGKFYEGGGKSYEPFGRERQYTAGE